MPRKRGRFRINTEMKIKVVLFFFFHLYLSRCAHIIPCRSEVFTTIRISWHIINYLVTGLFPPYKEIRIPHLYERTSQARSVLKKFGLRISWYGPSNSVSNIYLLDGYSSCPAFSQFDWLIIGQDSAILPDGFSC